VVIVDNIRRVASRSAPVQTVHLPEFNLLDRVPASRWRRYGWMAYRPVRAYARPFGR